MNPPGPVAQAQSETSAAKVNMATTPRRLGMPALPPFPSNAPLSIFERLRRTLSYRLLVVKQAALCHCNRICHSKILQSSSVTTALTLGPSIARKS
jgi:hypothetical protein